jgi:hypothetical protein
MLVRDGHAGSHKSRTERSSSDGPDRPPSRPGLAAPRWKNRGWGSVGHPCRVSWQPAHPDGNLWFTDSGSSAIGVGILATSDLVITQQPLATVKPDGAFGLHASIEGA